MTDHQLLALAAEASKKAYSRYSGFSVGAALLAKDGSVYTKKTDNPKGEPEIPLSADEIIMKFKSLADFSGADSEMTECILDSVDKIMDEEKYNWLIERTIKL